MRIQELMFIVIGIFMAVGTIQEEVRIRWKRSKMNTTRS